MAYLRDRLAVVGGGRMGAGIAQVCLAQGATVTVVEADQTTADAARQRVLRGLEKARDKGTLGEQPDEVLARLDVVASIAALPADVPLVVEAVPEDLGIKTEVLSAIERIVAPSTVLATNTSSFSINELSAVLDRPGRFIGMHFFNPVPASRLIEIVAGSATEPEVVEVAQRWALALGKRGVVIRDAPGFATSRLGVTLGLEAIRMVEAGVATPEAIDEAITLAYRHPVGPLRLTDFVGLDVRLGVAEYLAERLGPRFEPPELLRQKVAAGELGRKVGKGFFEWNDG